MATAIDAGRSRYTSVAIALHWTIAVLIIANLVIGLLHESLLKGAIPLHKSIGMTVLALSVIRLGWRLTHRPPPLPPSVRGWEKGLAHLVHWAIYALMILIPLSGWIFVSAGLKRHPIDFFGLFPLPQFPIAQNEAVNHAWHGRHTILAYMMIALLVLHVVAALKHRLWDRDRTVDRMWPGVGPA